MRSQVIAELWQERSLLAPAFACANGVGYLSLLVLPWTLAELISSGAYSATQAGLIATAEISALAAASLLFAKRATRPRRSRLALAGITVALAANLLAMIPSGTVVFIVERVAAGAGLGCAVAVGNAAAAGSRNPSRAFSAIWFAMALWQLLIFNLTPWAMSLGGLNGAYALMAAGCAAFLPLALRTPDPPVAAGELPSVSQPSGAALGRPATVLLIVAFAAFWLRDALVYSLSQVLSAARGISGAQLGQWLGVATIVGLLGPAMAARLADPGRKRAALFGGLIAVMVVSVLIAASTAPGPLMAGLLLMPLTGLFVGPLLSGLAADLDATGRLVAVCAGVGFFSEAIGPAVGTAALEFGGSRALATTVLACGVLTLASVAWLKGRERYSTTSL